MESNIWYLKYFFCNYTRNVHAENKNLYRVTKTDYIGLDSINMFSVVAVDRKNIYRSLCSPLLDLSFRRLRRTVMCLFNLLSW